DSAREVHAQKDSPIIIFSDLHMGNGKKNDDFKKNAEVLKFALDEYYKKNYNLILNGDIEELQKFTMSSIHKTWPDIYNVFDKFDKTGRLTKITGNHDDSILHEENDKKYNEEQAIKLFTQKNQPPMFIFHGHQASIYYKYLNKLNTILLRYIVNPLGIKNFSKKSNYMKKMRVENRSYNFSRKNKIVSIIGHTHRPLFESMSRADSLHFTIETLLRSFRTADSEKQTVIARQIKELKNKYDECIKTKPHNEPASLMYSKGIAVPCLFNTGCTIGKRGITGIEITSEKISLIHWFDSRVSNRFLFDPAYSPNHLETQPHIYRVVLRSDRLDYIFDSIKLLGKSDSDVTPDTSISFTENKWNTNKEPLEIKQSLTFPY
ncbi:MAG: metallophosphoesterase family protein, partial [Spirochaetales bacterium]|nr:metallophosphoesterase family protein [Spirochaetales bacterium]